MSRLTHLQCNTLHAREHRRLNSSGAIALRSRHFPTGALLLRIYQKHRIGHADDNIRSTWYNVSMRVVAAVVVLIALVIPSQASPKPTTHRKPSIMLGGPSHAPIDETTNEVGQFAVSQLNHKANVDGKPLSFVKVVSARQQVVAGMNYFLTLEAKDASGQASTWEVTVWKKLPQADNAAPMELTKFSHVKQPGGDCSSEQQWEAAAQQLVSQINSRSNSLFPAVLSAVASATPANDHSSIDMVLELTRGGKQERYQVKGSRRADNKYALVEAVLLAAAVPPT